MFAKLLKHEWKATWGLLGILSLLCLGAGVLGASMIRVLENYDLDGIWEILFALAFATVIVYLVAYCMASLFVLLSRFYRSLFTDEGYLTFTLPVTTHQILLSNLLNSFLGLLLTMVLTAVSLGILFFFGISAMDGQRMEFFRVLFARLPEFIDQLGLGNILITVVTVLIAMLGEIVCIQLALTIGAVVARKHKILAAIGAYYGIHMLTGMLDGWLMYSGSFLAISEFTQATFLRFMTMNSGMALVQAGACYFAMYFLIHKRLNLN